MGDFEYINIEQMKVLKKKYESYKEEFDNIAIKFGEINETLLENWEGFGALIYYDYTKDALDNIGNLDRALEVMNEIYDKIIEKIEETDETLASEIADKMSQIGANVTGN